MKRMSVRKTTPARVIEIIDSDRNKSESKKTTITRIPNQDKPKAGNIL